jgi:hypothetical protein
MELLTLTGVGRSLAATPSNEVSDARRALYWMRRRGGSCTSEQLADFFGGDRMKARLVTNSLTLGDVPAVVKVVRQ